MSLTFPTLRRQPKHRAADRLAALEPEYRRIKAVVVGSDAAFNQLRERAAEAEVVAACTLRDLEDVTEERDQLAAEVAAVRARLAPLEAAEANRNALTVPAPVRDTSHGADQATAPINVRPLWAALGVGPVQATPPAA